MSFWYDMGMKKLLSVCLAIVAGVAHAVTTGIVPADGVYRFTFGTDSVAKGFAVSASAVFDATKAYANTAGETFTYGFLGTTAESYKTDKPWSLPAVAHAIDGFSVVQGQSIQLRDVAGKGVSGPSKSQYLPAGVSAYEGRYPIRFSMSAEENAYYAVTCTVINVSSTEPADVTLFSERCHLQAHHLTLRPDETRTFAWGVELAPNVFKSSGTYRDDAINVVVVGENAGLQSLVVVKQPQREGTVRGVATEKMNVGKTMWLCDDSTGTDQRCDTPYFSLQNYSGVGSGLSRYAPATLAIRNQGEGGLATNANAHRKSCLLKPGDYLYVEYGHNESSVDSYTANLELYLADANAAGANLIIVSPLERRSSWNSETSTWNRSLQSYAEAGEAWVNAKIAAGTTNVAFIDLNKRYNDWMNAELQRIHAVNPSVSLNAAISYYYRSAKGANVDNTHINNAGTDQAAYWVWYDALQRVAAGERDGATEAERVQAAVLKGITEGYQGTVGLDSSDANLPWQVTDEIIISGAAPNAFWDTPVTAGFAYAHDAAVAAVDATANVDGSVTLKGVTMRILNPNNYYKAVVEVTDAAGAKTRYYSYYNYDVGGAGKLSGDLVTPEQPGFLTSDKNKADVAAVDLSAVTIPAKGKAEVWIAEADAGTWQVGAATPCSAKFPIEWWSKTLVDETCSTAENWKVLTQAVYTTNIVDGVLSFTSTGADANNTKKNMGLYHALDGDVASGRYRISFKVMIDAGGFSVLLGDTVNTTTTVFKNSISLLKLDGTTVTSYQATTPSVTLSAEGEPQAKVNAGRWLDVDLIVDRDNAQAWISVGGSEYVEWREEDFVPGSFAGLTWKYFGLSLPAQQSTFGYVDDVKILKLAPVKSTSDKYTIKTWDDFTDGDGLSFALTGSDSRSSDGLVWVNSANKSTNEKIAYGKYIAYTPERDGLLVLKFSVDNVVAKREPTLCVNAADAASDCMASMALAKVKVTSAETEYILKADLEAGTTYYIWPYSYNWEGGKFYHNYTIASVAYIYETPHERVFDVAAGENEISFVSVAGAWDVIKRGEGTLRFAATNSFTGCVSVEAGTLRLSDYRDLEGVRFDYDFGHEETYADAIEAVVDYVTGANGKYSFTGDRPWVTNDVAVLNGRTALASTAMRIKTKAAVLPKNSVGTTFAVAQYLTSAKSGKFIGDWSDAYYGMRWYWAVSGNKMNWHPNGSSAVNGRINGVPDGTVGGDPFVFATTNKIARVENGARALSFGGAAAMAWGEVVNYSRILSGEELAFVEVSLMDKWGISAASILPGAADVSVSAGATLDLGIQRPAVAHVTLAAGSVLAVDAVHAGEVLLTAQTIVNEGAVLKVGGVVSTRFALTVINNPDGTQSLVAQRKGLLVIFK